MPTSYYFSLVLDRNATCMQRIKLSQGHEASVL